MIFSKTRFEAALTVAPVVALALLACKKEGSEATPAPTASVAAPASAAAPAGEALRPEPGALCTASEKKVYGKWANQRTGITARNVNGKLTLGVAIGNKPHALSFDKQGQGQLTKLSVPEDSQLAKDISQKEGSRDLQRVTPVSGEGGQLTAYVDYRDKYKTSKRRRIACELLSNNKPVLVFDDVPLLDKEKKEEPPKTAEAPDAGAPSAAALAKNPALVRRLKISQRAVTGPAGTPAAAPGTADAAAPVADKPAEPPKEKKKALREIRDCRTFVDADGHVWGLGSELHGEPQDDDSVKWSMRLFVAPDAGGGYFVLNSTALPKEPKELHTFEAPTAGELGSGELLVTTRYRGSLMTWMLNAQHRPSGRSKTHRGGWPSMAELFADDGGLLLLTSQRLANKNYELRYGRTSGSGLPGSLEKITIDGAPESLSEPSFALVGSQRWLSFQAGSRRDAQLMIAPVDASFKPLGKGQVIAEKVVESALYPLADGKILAVTLESGEGGSTDLASRVLTCSVKS